MSIILDVGCGRNKVAGALGVDVQNLPGVDIVHDLEEYPWPIEDGVAQEIHASHIVEHINPARMGLVRFMNECWRVATPRGFIYIAFPVGGSYEFWQDPTHCNAMNQTTWQYFDPDYEWYRLYTPRPWQIVSCPEPHQPTAPFIQVVLRKREE